MTLWVACKKCKKSRSRSGICSQGRGKRNWKDLVIKSDLMLSVSRLTQMHFTTCINWRIPLFFFLPFKPRLQINYCLLSSSPPAAALGCLSPCNFGTRGRTKVLCAAPTAHAPPYFLDKSNPSAPFPGAALRVPLSIRLWKKHSRV